MMRAHSRRLLLLGSILLLGAAPVCAQFLSDGPPAFPPDVTPPAIKPEDLPARPQTPPPPPPDPSVLREQLALLEQFLNRTPEELRKMRQTIEMIERMDTQEREFLRVRIRQITARTPEAEDTLARWKPLVPRERQGTLNKYWLSLSPTQRQDLETALSAASTDEAQAALLRGHLDQFDAKLKAAMESMRQRQLGLPKTAGNPG